MQLEITLSQSHAGYSAEDLSFLLHKHPKNLHERELAWGKAYIFYPELSAEKTKAVLFLDVDPIGLVRGRSEKGPSLLAQYVNDRPYAANSFLSVALSKSFGQSLSGKSRERQEMADEAHAFSARITPVAIAGGEGVATDLFTPLGYDVSLTPVGQKSFEAGREFYDLRLSGEVRLSELLNHLYVLIPVLDNAKHFYIDTEEIENLLSKGEGWLQGHPHKELITRRALKHKRSLANIALSRLAELEDRDTELDEEQEENKGSKEEQLEKPIRLHDLRLDRVAEILKERKVKSVLDLGCGEGKLLKRLIQIKGTDRIVGVDASIATLERASEKLYLKTSGDKLRERVKLMQGSLTYADRRWEGFDAATLVEVIEHIDIPRLSALEQSLFGVAKPSLVVITTPNCEYNALFATMSAGQMRHADHRFEWTREEFQSWANRIAKTYQYDVSFYPLGPEDETHGAPSQMGVFAR